jgi:hypothetical protein
MTLVAKTIVNNKFWIVLDGPNKVGAITVDNNSYTLNLGAKRVEFSSAENINDFLKLEFQRPSTEPEKKNALYSAWPNTGKTFNDMIDIQRRLHLFTKEQHSKCYYVSGWFRVKTHDHWETCFCPKYLYIQRYDYRGPFCTREQAEENA